MSLVEQTSTELQASNESAGFEMPPNNTEPPDQVAGVDSQLPEDVGGAGGQMNAAAVQRATAKIGRIHISFPEYPDTSFEGRTDFPRTYRTLSPKERLLLLFAENFRQQFGERYAHRSPPILAVCNECEVQVGFREHLKILIR